MKLSGYFHSAVTSRTTGFNKEGGHFWIGFGDDVETPRNGAIAIELTVWSEHSPSQSTYASIRVYHDGIAVIRELEKIGFLTMFEEIQANNFYDVAQCCARCDVPIMYHGGDYTKEMTPRKIYELLYSDPVK